MPFRFSSIHVALILASLSIALVCQSGCSKSEDLQKESLYEINLQTDWFPQPEHGGFYQALANGYYAEAGLRVNIIPGGPNAMSTQKVLKGRAHFAMNRADTIYSLVNRGVPIVMVMATLQHDPQAIMLHEGNPVERLEDLDGHSVMAIPGLMWIRWLEAKYKINLTIIPHDYGLERFLNDPDYIQQCMMTNEPFYAQQAGVSVKVLPLRASGFDPYHGIYCLDDFAREHPEIVDRFVTASIRGWKDFIMNDPAPALRLISEKNPKMNQAFMEFSYRMLRDENLISGQANRGESIGDLDTDRMRKMVSELHALGLIEGDSDRSAEWFTRRFLLTPGDVPSDEHP